MLPDILGQRTLPRFRSAIRRLWRPSAEGGVHQDAFQQWAYARSMARYKGHGSVASRAHAAALVAVAATELLRDCALYQERDRLTAGIGALLEAVAVVCAECDVDLDDAMAARMRADVERLS